MRPVLFTLSGLLLLTAGCSTVSWQKQATTSPSEVEATADVAPFLKVHTPDGGVYVLESWKIDEPARLITGRGILYDVHRQEQQRGDFNIPFDQVGVLETNRPEAVRQQSFAVLAVMSGVSLGATAVCLASPKSCFGSCPTFYVDGPDGEQLYAEGFSASIARALEETDVDAMEGAPAAPGPFTVRMVNEALETHAVREVSLHVAPRPEGGRVYRAGGSYFAATTERAPSTCRGVEGECTQQVATSDGVEYHSRSDGIDLAAREIVELEFPAGRGQQGLVLTARTSLLSTFIYYQSLAYMGTQAGRWQLRMEYGLPQMAELYKEMLSTLGEISVQVQGEGGEWQPVGSFQEYGPIARETQLILLPDVSGAGTVKLRLDMTRANWKLDRASLVEIVGEVQARVVLPERVRGSAQPEALAMERLAPGGEYLYTYPGDVYEVDFELPSDIPRPEVFLSSRGYYYEWMREQWLVEEDPEKVVLMMGDSQQMFRELAPRWKEMEPHVDDVFEQSRFGRTP